jgi:hypothetical protein
MVGNFLPHEQSHFRIIDYQKVKAPLLAQKNRQPRCKLRHT